MSKEGKYLNDDVFFDVLSRLPAKTLIRLKLVSKGWHALISDRCFADTQIRRSKLSFTGFVFQQRYQWSNEDIKTATYIPVGEDNFRVQQAAFDFLPDDVVVLTSCAGLVCCRSCFPTQDPAIYICNPVNKEWVTLRWSELDQDSNIALAYDPLSDSVNFKLVRVKQFESGEEEEVLQFMFDVYCSKTRDWTKAKEVCKGSFNLSKNSVYINGTMHWLTEGDEILTFSLESELLWLISVPVPASEFNTTPQSCFGESGGKLHYVMISEQGLSLWCLKDYFESEWIIKKCVSLETIEKDHPEFFCNLRERASQVIRNGDTPWVNPMAFQGDLLLMRVSTTIYLYSFDTGKMQEVCDVSELGSNSMFSPTVLPYSMSLVPLIS